MSNNGGLYNFSNINEQEETKKVTDKLRICMYLLFSLALFRIFSFQFYGLFSDLIAAAIVYCTYSGKGKIMAMFCLINAFLGIVYSISMGSMDLTKLNKVQDSKSPYDTNNNNNINAFNYNNNNSQFANENLNRGNIPNKDIYGIRNNIADNNFATKNNNSFLKNNNNQNLIDNNNYDYLGNKEVINDNKSKSDSGNSFSYFYILIITIYAVIIYAILVYFSFKAFEIYKLPFGEMQGDSGSLSSGHSNGQNYGALDTNRNEGYSNVPRSSTTAAPTANSNRNFVPFNGTGQRLED